MKKPFLAAIFVSALTACNSNGNSNDSGDTASGNKVSAVENVNGNLPDTSNTINLGGNKDTTTAGTGNSQ